MEANLTQNSAYEANTVVRKVKLLFFNVSDEGVLQ
jgi:hypothetical protein